MMDTIEHFSEFLKKIGSPNLLAVGIVIIVLWFLISGFLRGLRKRGRNKDSEGENNDE